MLPGPPGVVERRPARVTYILIVVNTIVYLATSYRSMFLQVDNEILWRYSFIPGYLPSLDAWLRILFSMFLHGYPLHIIFNMYFLYIFGRDVEPALGGLRYTILYVLSGIGAAMMHTAMSLFIGVENLGIPALGASGAISGVLGAFLMFYPGASMSVCIFVPFPICGVMSSTFFILSWFILQLVYGYLQMGSVAFFAHVGGFLTGMVLAYILGGRERPLDISTWGYSVYRRGLGLFSRAVLVLSSAAIIATLVFSAPLLSSTTYVHILSIKASVVAQGGFETSSEALVVILAEENTSRYIVAPITDEVARVLFNRVYYAGYIVNRGLAGYTGPISFSGYVSITGLTAPPVRLVLDMNYTRYTRDGVIEYGVGSLVTDLLRCDPSGVCSIAGVWRYPLFTITLVSSSTILDVMLVPYIVSIAVSLLVIALLVSRKDLEVSRAYSYDLYT